MKITKNILTFLTIILFGLACLDIITTLNLVNQAGSWENELNPITVYTVTLLGVGGAIIIKLLAMVGIIFFIPWYACKNGMISKYIAYNGLVSLNLFYIFIVVAACFGGMPI